MRALPRNWIVGLTFGLWLSLITYTAPAQDAGLLLYLPLTTDLADHSGNGHSITNKKNVRIEDGAAYFDGMANWLEAPNLPLKGGNFAVSLWVNPPAGILCTVFWSRKVPIARTSGFT